MSVLLTIKIHYISKIIQLKDIIQDFVLQEQNESQLTAFWSIDQDDCILTIYFIFNSNKQALAQDILMIDFFSQIREMWEKIEMEFHKVIIDEISRQQIPIVSKTQLVKQI